MVYYGFSKFSLGKKSGLSLSAYLRKVGLEKEIYPIPDKEFYRVYIDICKVKNAIDETLPIEKIKQCLEIISNEFLDIYNSKRGDDEDGNN